MSSKQLIEDTRRYILENPQSREYERNTQNSKIHKTVNVYKCSFCDWEHGRILATAAHIKKNHSDKMEKEPVKDDKKIDIPENKSPPSLENSSMESHELNFEEIPPKKEQPSLGKPASSHKELDNKETSEKKPSSDQEDDEDEDDDWLDFFDD